MLYSVISIKITLKMKISQTIPTFFRQYININKTKNCKKVKENIYKLVLKLNMIYKISTCHNFHSYTALQLEILVFFRTMPAFNNRIINPFFLSVKNMKIQLHENQNSENTSTSSRQLAPVPNTLIYSLIYANYTQ